jgi:hypothetical protein
VAIRYGIGQWRASYNPLWLNLLPALQWLGLPAPSPELPRSLPAQQRRWLIAGAVLLFANVVYAVHRQGQWPDGQQPLLWALLALHTLALGAWADGRRWGSAVCAALELALPLLFIGLFGLRDAWGVLPMMLLAGHAAGLLSLPLLARPSTT